MKEFDVFVSGKATFTWSDCNGGGSETKQLYPGATPTGMSCEFSPFSYACSLSGQNADYKTSVSLTINSGTTPKLTTISGTCVRNVFYGSAPDGTYNRDEFTVTFTNLPLYDSTQCQFGAMGPKAPGYMTKVDLKEFRWSDACSTMVVRTATTLACTDSTYRGDGVMISVLR